MTHLVVKLPLAFGRPRNSATRSRTLSEISASTERSPFSPRSYTQSRGSTWFGSRFGPSPSAWRAMAAPISSMLTNTVIGFACPLRRAT